MTHKKALITGITGQIGSYLAELLVEKGYEVYGFSKESSSTANLKNVQSNVTIKHGNLEDLDSLEKVIREIVPDEIYNLAAQSNSSVSMNRAEETIKVNLLALVRLLDTAQHVNPQVRICQASSVELFGGMYDHPMNEETAFHPRNPYATAKLGAYWLLKNYREIKNLFCSNAIIFNTESPRRQDSFVTRKITRGVADISKGKQTQLYLGSLDARRDWSHAADTAHALYLMLQHTHPSEFVIASGKAHTIREFVTEAFTHIHIHLRWRGQGLEEEGYDAKSGVTYVKVDPKYFRPAELKMSLGDASKAHRELNWQAKHSFSTLVQEMMEHDLT